jgi:hypothetical protein
MIAPPVFSQVVILEESKVLCFDRVLQVLILKGVIENGDAWLFACGEAKAGTPTPGVLGKEAAKC